MPLAVAGLLLLVWAAYHAAPGNAFHFDDHASITERASVRIDTLTPAALLAAGRDAALPRRPLPSITFAFDWWRGGGAPRAFLQSNVALHVVNVLLVFALLLELLRRAPGASVAPGVTLAAAAGAALFAVHPLQVQAVTYVVQRMTELATLFTLLSTWCYLRGRRARASGVGWFAAVLLAYALGAACKEIAWPAPLLWLLVEYAVGPRAARAAGARDRWLRALPALLALYVLLDIALGGPLWQQFVPGYANRPFTPFERLMTQPRVMLFHVGQLLWPWPGRFSLEHDIVVSTGLLRPASTLAALFAVVAWCVVGYLAWLRGPRRVGLCMLWVPLTLAIESSLVPLEMLFEHRMYLPMFGFAGLLALGVRQLSGLAGPPRRIALAAVGAALLLCAAATVQRVADWTSSLRLLESARRHAPLNARLHGNLASLYYEAGRRAAARRAAETALARDPRQANAHEVLAFFAIDRGDLASARRHLEAAVARRGERHHLLNLRGELELASGRAAPAASAFERAVAQAPWLAQYYWNLALARAQAGKCAAARAAWAGYLEREADAAARAALDARLDAAACPR